jgi:hypothetical protein
MRTEQENLILWLAVVKWGEPAQLLMMCEECNELSHAVLGYMRGKTGHKEIIEEMVDVQIMLDQMKFLVAQSELARVRDAKMNRLAERLGISDKDGG